MKTVYPEEEVEDTEDPYVKTKKPGDETSDEEKEWLTALEKGELDDYGEVSKGKKDPTLMTARQVHMLRDCINVLLQDCINVLLRDCINVLLK